jgi:hypothetical protein
MALACYRITHEEEKIWVLVHRDCSVTACWPLPVIFGFQSKGKNTSFCDVFLRCKHSLEAPLFLYAQVNIHQSEQQGEKAENEQGRACC